MNQLLRSIIQSIKQETEISDPNKGIVVVLDSRLIPTNIVVDEDRFSSLSEEFLRESVRFLVVSYSVSIFTYLEHVAEKLDEALDSYQKSKYLQFVAADVSLNLQGNIMRDLKFKSLLGVSSMGKISVKTNGLLEGLKVYFQSQEVLKIDVFEREIRSLLENLFINFLILLKQQQTIISGQLKVDLNIL
jgi:hypothetical protein